MSIEFSIDSTVPVKETTSGNLSSFLQYQY